MMMLSNVTPDTFRPQTNSLPVPCETRCIADALLELCNGSPESAQDQMKPEQCSNMDGYNTDTNQASKEKQCDRCQQWTPVHSTFSRRVGIWICQHCTQDVSLSQGVRDDTQGPGTRSARTSRNVKRQSFESGIKPSPSPKRVCKQPSQDRIAAASAMLGISDLTCASAAPSARERSPQPLPRSKRVVANKVCAGSSTATARSTVKTRDTHTTKPSDSQAGLNLGSTSQAACSNDGIQSSYVTPRPTDGSNWPAKSSTVGKDAKTHAKIPINPQMANTEADHGNSHKMFETSSKDHYTATVNQNGFPRLSSASASTLRMLATYFKMHQNPNAKTRLRIAQHAGISLVKVDEWFWYRNQLQQCSESRQAQIVSHYHAQMHATKPDQGPIGVK